MQNKPIYYIFGNLCLFLFLSKQSFFNLLDLEKKLSQSFVLKKVFGLKVKILVMISWSFEFLVLAMLSQKVCRDCHKKK